MSMDDDEEMLQLGWTDKTTLSKQDLYFVVKGIPMEKHVGPKMSRDISFLYLVLDEIINHVQLLQCQVE